MIIKKEVFGIVSRIRYLNDSWHILGTKNSSLRCINSFNLKRESGLFYNCMHRKYASLPISTVSENDTKKFLKHLVDAYITGKETEHEKLFYNHSIKKLIDKRIKLIEDIKNLEELENDQEMKKLAEEEKLENENQLVETDNELMELILENLHTDSYDDIILELTAGVGGQESMLFLKELAELYINHLTYLGYDFDIIESDSADQGGIRHLSIMISGKGSFQNLRHEAGVHRVQRVPATEKSGRMHTSVVSVAVLPQPSDIEVSIDPNDLKIDVMRASGAGGQHVNTTNSAVRITHLPTGTVAESQTDKSQVRNKNLAMAKLRAKIYQGKLEKQLQSSSSMRKKQMGMGERHEKIRTYNFSQDRITDHRISNGTMHNLKGFMEGGEALSKLHEKLHQQLLQEMLADVVKKVK